MPAPLDDLEAIVAAYATAIASKQPASLSALYVPDVVVFDAWEGWAYDGRDAWRANLDGWLGGSDDERLQVRFFDVRTRIGAEFGYLSAIVEYAALDPAGRMLRFLHNRLSWVLSRTATGWLIVHEHTSAPIRSGDGTAILKRD